MPRVAEHQNILITAEQGRRISRARSRSRRAAKDIACSTVELPRIFSELTLARADGSYPRVLAKIAHADVLVIDDFAMTPITDAERSDLFEVVDDRHGNRSTIISSQVPPKRFHKYIADPTHADANCHRLIHSAHKLVLKDPPRSAGGVREVAPTNHRLHLVDPATACGPHLHLVDPRRDVVLTTDGLGASTLAQHL